MVWKEKLNNWLYPNASKDLIIIGIFIIFMIIFGYYMSLSNRLELEKTQNTLNEKTQQISEPEKHHDEKIKKNSEVEKYYEDIKRKKTFISCFLKVNLPAPPYKADQLDEVLQYLRPFFIEGSTIEQIAALQILQESYMSMNSSFSTALEDLLCLLKAKYEARKLVQNYPAWEREYKEKKKQLEKQMANYRSYLAKNNYFNLKAFVVAELSPNTYEIVYEEYRSRVHPSDYGAPVQRIVGYDTYQHHAVLKSKGRQIALNKVFDLHVKSGGRLPIKLQQRYGGTTRMWDVYIEVTNDEINRINLKKQLLSEAEKGMKRIEKEIANQLAMLSERSTALDEQIAIGIDKLVTFQLNVEQSVKESRVEQPAQINNIETENLTPGRIISLNLGRDVKLELVWIPPGKFIMGSSESESGYNYDVDGCQLPSGEKTATRKFEAEGPRHWVRITKGFWMGKYEVTQEQWRAVMGYDYNRKVMGQRIPINREGPDIPVEYVSWNDCQEFLKKLTQKTGKTCRLPTEAEWEYACRAGMNTIYCFGDDPEKLNEYGWYKGNSGNKIHPVGKKHSNAWGIYDMHGNVYEWCSDWYGEDYYRFCPKCDPPGPIKSKATKCGYERLRVIRSGSYGCDAMLVRSAFRDGDSPISVMMNVGFRLVLPAFHDR